MIVPKKMFLTKGVGVDKNRLSSFELALRSAGIERFNLVYVSSILPPHCQIVTRDEGILELVDGQIVHCVMARNETNEPNRLISASIGVAMPKSKKQYGYLSEHHAFGQTAEIAGDFAEDLAATMLASTLGIPFDPDQAWDKRKKVYQASDTFFKASHFVQSVEGNKDGLWTTAIAAAVFVV
jgi:arginine decarboxylase